MIKVGLGQDSHRFETKKKPLILGGYRIPNENGLLANSDGDVIIHALCNALNTAIGYGSIDLYAGLMNKKGIIDSKEYLRVALEMVKKKGYQVNNLSFMIEAKRPRLERNRKKICASLAKLLRIEEGEIGMAFTSGEELTDFGKGKGIQVFCLVSLVK